MERHYVSQANWRLWDVTPELTADDFLSQLRANLRTLRPQPATRHTRPLYTCPKNYKRSHASSSDATRIQPRFNAPTTGPLKCSREKKNILRSSYVDEQTRYRSTDLNQLACATWDATSTRRSEHRTRRGTTHRGTHRASWDHGENRPRRPFYRVTDTFRTNHLGTSVTLPRSSYRRYWWGGSA